MGRIVSGIMAAMVSDWMLRIGVSTSATRKTFQALGNWSCGLCTLLLAFIPMTPALSMGFLVLAMTMQNLTSVAYKISLLDIAPRYAGLLNGVMSTVSTLAALPAPVITSLLVADVSRVSPSSSIKNGQDNTGKLHFNQLLCFFYHKLHQSSRQGWQAVFCMVAGLTTFGGLIFILFAQGEIQDWAVTPSKTTPTDLEVEAANRKRRSSVDRQDDTDDQYVAAPGLRVGSADRSVREVRSLPPCVTSPGYPRPKEKLKRSATVEVGAFVKRVRSQAFSNLPFSEF
ncbi:vesicular glutamate transporter 2 [Plakobranchus ocellatus]|uniref:Vesicular glutamate transporter 2 n=1 Tax=Plakobranchus ocellatus TaxID=259542 RepID=A0AAV4AEH6_9GAST|nr:vesicular glutamate transporter 2 [Plakobranchus ocellatus]